jgi:hypothetical protein
VQLLLHEGQSGSVLTQAGTDWCRKETACIGGGRGSSFGEERAGTVRPVLGAGRQLTIGYLILKGGGERGGWTLARLTVASRGRWTVQQLLLPSS